MVAAESRHDAAEKGSMERPAKQRKSAKSISTVDVKAMPTNDAVESMSRALEGEGAVVLRGLFSADQLQRLRDEHDAVLRDLDQKLSEAPKQSMAYLNHVEKKEYTVQQYWDIPNASRVLDVGRGRLDFTCGMDHGVFAEEWYHSPQVVAELMRKQLKYDFAHYCGAVPSRSQAPDGTWHRDTYSLFGDPTQDSQLPPFYYTVLVALNDVSLQDGPTEVLLGSHKDAGILPTSGENQHSALAAPLAPGDALLFDGRCIHRGTAQTTETTRRVLYSVWHKKWYFDYSEKDFGQGYSVCDPGVQGSP